jgi:hypothetical protein
VLSVDADTKSLLSGENVVQAMPANNVFPGLQLQYKYCPWSHPTHGLKLSKDPIVLHADSDLQRSY